MNTRMLGAGALVAFLLVVLAVGCVFAYQGLTVHSDFQMPAGGYVALGFGVFFSLIVGIGLMTLVFYSSRAGYDEAAQRLPDDPDGDPPPADRG
jgi:hypothetical protein